MSVKIKKDENCFIASFRGSLLASSYNDIINIITKAIDESNPSRRFIVLNFEKVTLITSVIMNAVNQMQEKLNGSGLNLCIIAAENEVFDILEITGFNRIFPVYNSFEEFKKNNNIK